MLVNLKVVEVVLKVLYALKVLKVVNVLIISSLLARQAIPQCTWLACMVLKAT